MIKLKLATGAFLLLLLTFCFSSYLSLTALANLYTKSLGLPDSTYNYDTVLNDHQVQSFISGQIVIAIIILLLSSIAIFTMIAWYVSSKPDQWSMKNVGWPLFILYSVSQLVAQGLYINNFIALISIDKMISAGLLVVFVEIITVLVIAALLFVELLTLLFKYWQKSESYHYHSELKIDYISIRPVIFLYLIGYDLSIAFIPLHMEKIYQPLLSLPEDIVLGLPISGMFMCISITIVIAGIWLDKRGWHEPFLIGLILSAFGMFLAWFSSNSTNFIIAMCLSGLGYGLALMASQGFIITFTDDKTKARGLANLFAGNFAGSICGTAIGAMLAERIGYNVVFLIASIIIILSILYTLIALKEAIKVTKNNRHQYAATFRTTTTGRHYWNFLSNRFVLSLMFLSGLPSAIAVIGLLNYFVPVYLSRLGISQSIIGSVLILYALCMVYLGPIVSKYIDASENKRLFVITGCLLGSSAFLSFQFIPNEFIATIVAVLLLGISSCFVLASQTTYALMLDVTKQLGPGRSIGIFRASSRIGQVLGPIIFGWLIVSADIDQGLNYFGIGYLATAVLFAMATSSKSSFKKKTSCYENT